MIEQKLGFDRIRKQLLEMCSTAAGAGLMAEQTFSTSPAEVSYRQAVAEEVREALMMEHDFPKGELDRKSVV